MLQICMPAVIKLHNPSLTAQGLQGSKPGTLIHDLQQAAVEKPDIRFSVRELLLSGGTACVINPPYSNSQLSSMRLALCLADWQTPQ